MGKRAALLVGINEYGKDSGLHALHYAEADTELLATTLEDNCSFTTKILKGEEATLLKITQELRVFYERKDLDLFLFYFAGHGELIPEVGMHCLHCFGSEARDSIGTLNLFEWAIRIRDKIYAPHSILVVDACRNRVYRDTQARGTGLGLDAKVCSELKWASDAPQDFGTRTKTTMYVPRLLFTLLACGIGQVSYEDHELRHGIFTHALAEEIKTNGQRLPLGQLRKRVGDQTWRRCVDKGWHPVQIPEWVEPSLSGEVFLADVPTDGSGDRAGEGSESIGTVNPPSIQLSAASSGDGTKCLTFDLGVETLGGVFTPMIARGTLLPHRHSEVFSTAADNQLNVEVHVLQGLRPMAKDDLSVGKFQLLGIPPAQRGVPQIEVMFDVDSGGVLRVSATDLATRRKQEITLSRPSEIGPGDLTRLLEEAAAHAAEDQSRATAVEVRNSCDSLTYAAEKTLRENREKLPLNEMNALDEAIKECRLALAENNMAMIARTTETLTSALHRVTRILYGAV
jgi:hypothetical protein